MRIATRRSWRHKKLPEQHAFLDYHERFTQEEYDRILRGLIPREMEDKWFIFMEGDVLCLHRSWTGYCIYQVEFAEESGTHVARTVKCNRDRDQWKGTDDQYEVELLRFLIRGLLLGEETEFPVPGDLPKDTPWWVFRHHVVGYGRSGEEAGAEPCQDSQE